MKNDEESSKSIKELKKAIKEGINELSNKNISQLLLLEELKDTLSELEKCKAKGMSSSVKKYENSLKRFECVIDKKYWNDFALFYIIMAISCRVTDNMGEAIKMYDNFNG